MVNFTYSIPTTVHFGQGQVERLPQELKAYGTKLLLCYGGGSIKRIGLYDTVTRLLKENGFTWVELPGIDPNPRVTSVRQGAALCKEHGLEMVLAVGGGSSLDCAKAIAAAACYDGDAWDLVIDHSKIKKNLPVFSVLTLSATGSEMDAGGVISNLDTNEKRAISNPGLKPVASIMDPTYTFTVPKNQTAAGTADIMSHTLENYFTRTQGAYLQSRMAEAILDTCICYAPIALAEPENYEARANLMWASSWAINGLLKLGTEGSWSVHPMEHELSAFYDITHGVGLAILTPHWMRYVLDRTTISRFVEYGVRVWHINPTLDAEEIANKAIDYTADFFQHDLGLPATLREVGIGEENLEIMAQKAAAMGLQNAYHPLSSEDVLAIYKAAL